MEESTSACSRSPGLRKPLVVALASAYLALTVCGPASASISLTPQQLFNFDFTNPPQPPGGEPPYSAILLDMTLSGGPGSITLQLFPDLDGGGSSSLLGPFGLGLGPAFVEFGLTQAGVLDGKFSVGLLSSTLLLDNGASAIGCKDFCNFETAAIAGRLVSVPEPGSLALLGIAVAGFAATRRKRRS